jgi:hypothetical protein
MTKPYELNGRFEAAILACQLIGCGRLLPVAARPTREDRYRPRQCKNKTDLAVNKFCKIQTSKSRRFEPRLGFFARFDQFTKVPRVFTQPRPYPDSDDRQLWAT